MEKKVFYKEIEGQIIFYNGESIILGEWRIINPTEEQLLEAGWMIWIPEEHPIPPRTLEQAKDEMLAKIDEYDDSTSVNGIIVNGVELWIPAEQRAILKTSVDAYQTLGIDSITKVWEGVEYTATADQWLYMIATVEVYASECFNVTARHKAAVMALDNIEDVDGYAYTEDYPEKPNFTVDNNVENNIENPNNLN